MNLQPKGLDHIAIKVTDLAKSVHFYHDVLGLELTRPFTGQGRAAAVKMGDQKIDIFYREDFVSASKMDPVGVDHMCLTYDVGDATVDDIFDYLREQDVEVMWGPVIARFGGHSTSIYVYDPDGIHVELRFPTPVADEPKEEEPAREP
ncbi:MAG TPA: VOC family protein, partial [Chloroflexota bacterium]|nr:VOC family protein [Chloroflexota bacterium]